MAVEPQVAWRKVAHTITQRSECYVPTDFMKLFQVLNAAGARYVIVGGLASLLHGVGRSTTDVDICSLTCGVTP